ncbi:hypothetical protein SLEP1_g25218 [Rubroshorea leprosula]|uniref:Uncharacterized protein n=1 Tax=Rubroshorea leprosula TaxID=152421 RepID=A0AAV5JPC8_9ROSI|nr:hypothetical protein SLEP1_g25218 [Rubroshorea leprosula]
MIRSRHGSQTKKILSGGCRLEVRREDEKREEITGMGNSGRRGPELFVEADVSVQCFLSGDGYVRSLHHVLDGLDTKAANLATLVAFLGTEDASRSAFLSEAVGITLAECPNLSQNKSKLDDKVIVGIVVILARMVVEEKNKLDLSSESKDGRFTVFKPSPA